MGTGRRKRWIVSLAILVATMAGAQGRQNLTLTHVSFDISREVVKGLSDGFVAQWERTNPGSRLSIEASHAGSSKQVQTVLNGFPADLVTMNQFLDLQNLYDQSKDRGALIPADWTRRLPQGASPFASTMVFVVRAGNPKGIRDWGDLARPGLSIVAPNWKTTGNGRYSYLSAWIWALRQPGGTTARAEDLVVGILKNIPVFANGGRDATNLFDQRGQGDVLLTFEAEARQIEALKPGTYQVVTPSFGLLTRIYAVTVEKVARERGTEAVAKAYWDFVFSPAGQEIAARHFFRPNDPAVAARYSATLPPIPLVEFDSVFGDWERVEREHFGTGGIYDRLWGRR